jgi:diadenosine tetraphosphate (Ap4A) HIT family hydrolase
MAINPDTPTSVDLIECSEHCAICELHSNVELLREVEIWRNRHWLLRHHPHPSPLLGWCLLDARRHLAGAVDFLGDEAAEWGTVVQQASKLVQKVSGCDRVYLIAFGEGARHLHLHLIPRFQEDQRSAAWSVADLYRDVEAGRQPLVQAENVQEFLVAARSQAQNSFTMGLNKS